MSSDENKDNFFRNTEDDVPQSLGFGDVMRNLKTNKAEGKNAFVNWRKLDAKEGDLIEIERIVNTAHWGVSECNGNIIHIRDGGDRKAIVARDSLKDVAGNSKCRVNNLEAAALRLGLKAKSPDEILRDARSFLGQRVDYDPFKRNCENFVTHCRFGSGNYIPGQSGFSEQALAAKGEGSVKAITRVVANGSMLTESISSCSKNKSSTS
jgi:hypothetical protein